MGKPHKYINPFYALLIPVGVAFVISATAYGVMMVRDTAGSDSGTPQEETGLLGFMDQHGVSILGIEVGLLGLFSLCAIGTDEIWFRRAAAKSKTTSSQLPDSDSTEET
jgi:hypothetical protein